jgi:hypothetical protein
MTKQTAFWLAVASMTVALATPAAAEEVRQGRGQDS